MMSLVVADPARGPIWDVSAQGTPGWIKARQGCLTASRMADAMAWLKKGGEAEARRQLKIDLLVERLTGFSIDHYVTKEMQWGIDHEAEARATYEELTGNRVQLCGFALHPDIPFFGASPDGLLGREGLLEIKCPTSRVHLTWTLAGEPPQQHRPQMLAQLACTRRKYVDFISYDPRFPKPHNRFIRRFQPLPEEIAAVEEGAALFLDEVEQMWDQLTIEQTCDRITMGGEL